MLALYATSVKVATPATACATLPFSSPTALARSVTISAKSTSVRPSASCACTTGCVVSTLPDTAPAGCVANTSRVANTSDATS